MTISFDRLRVSIDAIKGATEKHGDSDRKAVDLSISFLDASALDRFDTRLRGAMFTAAEEDEAGKLLGEGHAPLTVKRGPIESIAVDVALDEREVAFDYGLGERNLRFAGAKLNKIRAVPIEGGTVGLSAHLRVYPGDSEDVSMLWTLYTSESRLTVLPPAQGDLVGGDDSGDPAAVPAQEKARRRKARDTEKAAGAAGLSVVGRAWPDAMDGTTGRGIPEQTVDDGPAESNP